MGREQKDSRRRSLVAAILILHRAPSLPRIAPDSVIVYRIVAAHMSYADLPPLMQLTLRYNCNRRERRRSSFTGFLPSAYGIEKPEHCGGAGQPSHIVPSSQ